MAWVRIHDGALWHPKIVVLFDWRHPFDVWIWGLSYCQMNLTDGHIPSKAVPKQANKAAAQLVTLGLWEVDQDAGGYLVHDYLDWNDSRSDVKARRDKTRTRIKAWRKHGSERRTNHNGNAVTNTVTEVVSTQVGNASPTLPNPVQERTHTARARGLTGSGAMAGTLPRDHLRHVFCGRRCVPEFLHAELKAGIGGDPERAETRLQVFYAAVEAGIPADAVVSDEPVKFWRAKFAAAFPSEPQAPATPAWKTQPTHYPAFDCPHLPPCGARHTCALKTAREATA